MTKLRAGVMGWPVEHSLSPKLHGYWLKHYGIDGEYVHLPVPPEGLEKALKELAGKGFRGVNLTVPHKEAAMKFLDHVDPAAQRIGAVNTVIVSADGKLEGRNTDVYGFAQNLLSAGYSSGKKPVVILGAGGAARSAVSALLDMNVSEIRIVNRTHERSEALMKSFGSSLKIFAWDDLDRALKDVGLLVNTTSLGMKNQPPLAIKLDTLPVDALVTDMVYAPLETDLLKATKARGNKTLDGLGMLLHQARPAFKAFFGKDPEVTEALHRFISMSKSAEN